MEQIERDAMHERIIQLMRDKKAEQAVGLCLKLLNDDRSDPGTLFQLSKLMMDQGNSGLSYHLMARAVKMRPDIPEMWVQFGQSHGETPEEWEKAKWCFHKAIKVAEKHGKELPVAHACLGTTEYLQGNYDAAYERLQMALALKPGMEQAMKSLSMVHLARQEWEQGWAYYQSLLGNSREQYAYGDEPEWDGTPGKRLIISGEQGLGDEIMYASCFPDVIADSPHVVIECFPRLEGLFRRSFPEAAAVYGTRWDHEVVWGEDHAPDAHCAMATLPKFYRRRTVDFPGGAYLKADPDISQAVAGIFRELGPNPKLGLAWTGGSDKTRGHLRARTLEELTPLLRVPDVDWISIEYYNRDEDIARYYEQRKIPIHTYHWLTERGLDYDLTAGLISQLDLLISVPTTGVQMAGALGVECWCLVPKYTGWMFAHELYPWAASVVPLRTPAIKDLEARLQEWTQRRREKAA